MKRLSLSEGKSLDPGKSDIMVIAECACRRFASYITYDSIKLIVEGPDMETIEASIPITSLSYTVEVPAAATGSLPQSPIMER